MRFWCVESKVVYGANMPQINKEKCDGCGTCLAVCPKCAMIMSDKAEIIARLCVNCKLCVKICPVGAVE